LQNTGFDLLHKEKKIKKQESKKRGKEGGRKKKMNKTTDDSYSLSKQEAYMKSVGDWEILFKW
jgi:hypothetical protein